MIFFLKKSTFADSKFRRAVLQLFTYLFSHTMRKFRHQDSDIKQERDPINSISSTYPVSGPVEHFLAVLQVVCLHGGIMGSVISAASRRLIINHSYKSDDSIFSWTNRCSFWCHNRASFYLCLFIDKLWFLVQQETQRWPVCCHASWCDFRLCRLTLVWRKSQPWLCV